MELQVATECCGGNQYECCGVGRCNVFCCNCDDGCKPMVPYYRHPQYGCYVEHYGGILVPLRRRAGNVRKPSARERFMAVDANGDNALDKHEFKSYLTATNRTFITDGFDGLDVNRNGYVDPHEFDRELH